jgi:hypothetical protein
VAVKENWCNIGHWGSTGEMVVGKMVETGYRVQFSPISCAAANNERRMVDFKMSVYVSNGTEGVPVKGSQAWIGASPGMTRSSLRA